MREKKALLAVLFALPFLLSGCGQFNELQSGSMSRYQERERAYFVLRDSAAHRFFQVW